MEAKQNSIVKFMQMQDAKFYIPVYQRNYNWREEQCKQLFKDILTVGTNDNIDSHFIGSIVYINMGTSIVSTPELSIIDGQQRLTTLTLFVAALAKRAKEFGKPEFEKKLLTRFLINEDLDDTEKLKLKPIVKDNNALRYILGIDYSEFSEYSRVIENFKYFYSNINEELLDIAFKGFQKLIFIEIALDKDKDEPQKIFQSLNSTGLDLSQSDLIRNYILMDRSQKEQYSIYDKYWLIIEENTNERNTKQSKMSEFIRDYLTFKFSSIPVQSKVFEVFKERFRFNSFIELIGLLEEIKVYSKFYSYFINPDIVKDDSIKHNLKLIKKLQINVAYPFLLQVFKAWDDKIINTDELNQVLELIQSFVWRRFICGVATNALNKIFMDLYKSIDESDFINSLSKTLITKKGSQRFPNNDEVLKELKYKNMYEIQSKNRTYFLEQLENYGKAIKTQVDNNESVSIEHILPQKPNNIWRNNLGDDYEELSKYIHCAANLTLSAFNSELSNSDFTTKRDLPDKGYKASPLYMDKILAEFTEWNLESYLVRHKWIEKRFLDIWKYPNIDISEDELTSDTIVNILDLKEDDVTHREIEYFIFFDEKYEKSSWKKLLGTVASIMFEREPEQFFDSYLQKYLKLTQNPEEIKSPIQISQSYYIEGWFSAFFLLRRVQTILELCETDDDLMIKLINNNK